MTTALQIDALWSGITNPTNGKAYSGAIVATFATGTSTAKAVWQDKDKTLPSADGQSQFTLDSNGQAFVFGDGAYKINIYAPSDTGLTSPLITIDGATYNVELLPVFKLSEFDSLSEAIAGSTGELWIDEDETLTGNISSPAALKIKFLNGNVISGAYTWTINGPFEAGKHQTFGSSLTVVGLTETSIYPEWWAENTTPGTTDMTDALNAAGSQEYGGELVLSDQYAITDTVTSELPVRGLGKERAILDASGASGAAWTGDAILDMSGTEFTAIEALGSNADKGDTTVTFASAPSLAVNDVFIIYDPTDESFSGHLAIYRAGEMCRVQAISGSTVTLQSTLMDSYVAATVDVYKLDGVTTYAKDFSIRGVNDISYIERGIMFDYTIDSYIQNVSVTGCTYSGLFIRRSYNTAITDCHVDIEKYSASVKSYPLFLVNTQLVSVKGGEYTSLWSGVATGGSDFVGCISNRLITVDGTFMGVVSGNQAFNTHGNQEYVTVTNCTIDGGYIFAGNHTILSNSIIKGYQDNGGAVRATELSGLDHVISNNYIWGNMTEPYGNLIDIGAGGGIITSDTPHGGTFVVDGNTMVWELASTTTRDPIGIEQNGYVGTESINIIIQNNSINIPVAAAYSKVVRVETTSGNDWGVVTIQNNTFKCGIEVTGADNVSILNNTLTGGAATSGISAVGNTYVTVNGNFISGFDYTGILASGVSGAIADTITVSNNILNECCKVSSTAINNSLIYIAHTGLSVASDNTANHAGTVYQTHKFNLLTVTKALFFDNRLLGVGSTFNRSGVTESNWQSAIPTSGSVAWSVGDIVWDLYADTYGMHIGNICVTAGAPGTWVPFGELSAPYVAP